MTGLKNPQGQRILLISTPWPLYDRPSVQLGVLKAHLRSQFPELRIEAHHLYLGLAAGLGYKLYRAVSERTWLSESVYGALLFPERQPEIEKVFRRQAKGKAVLRGCRFETLVARTKALSEELIHSLDWEDVALAGFSVCLSQLTSSLYFIREIKRHVPDLPVVVGGSTFPRDAHVPLLEAFPEIDYMVQGEGEGPLAALVRHITGSPGSEGLPPIAGVMGRNEEKHGGEKGLFQMEDLNRLPPPNYDDYFRVLRNLDPANQFFPTLPAEISRGCWWRSPKGREKRQGCAFCNLNLQWQGYRQKEASRVVSEVDYLTRRHKTLSVAFTDNLLPRGQTKEIFSGLAKLKKDFKLFGEMRATTLPTTLRAMKAAGMHEVQVGIEALSTRLLRKLRKGTTAIQNLEIMRDCEELGITNAANLILHFPGSNTEEVNETMAALEFAAPFRPLRCVYFWLGFGSAVWQRPRHFGLMGVFNHPNYGALFPPHIRKSIPFMIQSYRGDRLYQRRLWRPVEKSVKTWKKDYDECHKGPRPSPILGFRDGGDFLIVHERRPGTELLTHRLVGSSREIYLFCRRHKSLKQILRRFPQLGEERILPFLKMMVDKRLVFEENSRYLSLAVSVGERRTSGE